MKLLHNFVSLGTASLKFSMANAKKDLGDHNDMAEQSSSSHGIAQAVEKLLGQGIEAFGPDRMLLDLVEAPR